MRNPKRIKELMTVLTEIWEFHPDVRFNQLISSLQSQYKNGEYVRTAFETEVGWGMTPVSYPDLFYVEDGDFLTFLQKKLDELKGYK